jgi:hypothetical protein
VIGKIRFCRRLSLAVILVPVLALGALTATAEVTIAPVSAPIYYYVAPNGSDSNPGTMDRPWRTVQKALHIMVPADVASFQRQLGYTARVYYVDCTSGDDTNSGTSEQTAWRTLIPINRQAFGAGDTVRFKRGCEWSGPGTEWSSALAIGGSGTEAGAIVLTDYGEGNAPTITNPGRNTYITTVSGDFVVIEHLKFRNSHQAAIRILEGSDYNTVRQVEITDAGTGVAIAGTNNLVTESYIHDLHMVVDDGQTNNDYGAVGILFQNSANEASYNDIRRCLAASTDYGFDGDMMEIWAEKRDVNDIYVHHNYGEGNNGFMEIGGRSHNVRNLTMAQNLVVDSVGNSLVYVHTSGVFSVSIENILFHQNTIVLHKSAGVDRHWGLINFASNDQGPNDFKLQNNIIYVDWLRQVIRNGGAITHDHNLIYRVEGNGCALGYAQHETEITDQDVRFVNPGMWGSLGDFHLLAGSPAIDAGAGLGYSHDFDDNPIPVGAGYDIGAYEYQSSQPVPTSTATSTTIPTATPTIAATSTGTSTPTYTPQPTAARTNTPTSTSTAVPTATSTPTSTSAPTSTATSIPTPSHTPTSSPTGAATSTSTRTPTSTVISIATASPTLTHAATASPSSTATTTPATGPKEIVIDDTDAGFSSSFSQDAWQKYTQASGRHFGESHFYNRQPGTGQDSAVWSFTVPQPGSYEVYAWWWDGQWRPPDVPYTVNHLGGASTVRVNQQINGGQWNLLGLFSFRDRGSVVVSDDVSSGRDVVADAVRLVFVQPLPPAAATETPTASPTQTPKITSTSTPTFTSAPTSTPVPNTDPGELVVDNTSSGFSTSFSQDIWQEYRQPGGRHYGGSHVYNRQPGTGQDTATWSFTVPRPGAYQVYAWWWDGQWRPPDVPYTVNHLGGASTVRVNQQINGGQWNLLGVFSFRDRGSVVVSDDVSSGRDVVADAVRLVFVQPLPPAAATEIPTASPTQTPMIASTSTPTSTSAPTSTPVPNTDPGELVVDNASSGFSTSFSQDIWQEYQHKGGRHYGESHVYNRQPGAGQDTAVWSFTVPQPGSYEVYAWWWNGRWRPADVPYTVNHLGGASTVRVNQQINGGQWNLLGVFSFRDQGSVVVSDDVSSGRDVVADAIRVVYQGPEPPGATTSGHP